jgi:hypothetical protein
MHAVVVDMPRVISLTFASPESWSSLLPPDPPFEQLDANPGLQFAMNRVVAHSERSFGKTIYARHND